MTTNLANNRQIAQIVLTAQTWIYIALLIPLQDAKFTFVELVATVFNIILCKSFQIYGTRNGIESRSMLDKNMSLGGIECFDSIKRGRQIPVDSSLVMSLIRHIMTLVLNISSIHLLLLRFAKQYFDDGDIFFFNLQVSQNLKGDNILFSLNDFLECNC